MYIQKLLIPFMIGLLVSCSEKIEIDKLTLACNGSEYTATFSWVTGAYSTPENAAEYVISFENKSYDGIVCDEWSNEKIHCFTKSGEISVNRITGKVSIAKSLPPLTVGEGNHVSRIERFEGVCTKVDKPKF